MKKWKVTALITLLLLCIGMLGGCGESFAADTGTVFIRKDGSVVSTDVETFDTDQYDKDGLQTYIDDAISAYNEENGEENVKCKSLNVKDGVATLTITYATADDYQKFNGIELFTGSVAEALAAGYSFDDSFANVQGGEISACDDVSEFLDDSSYKVVIIRGNTNVQVKGSIAYVTTTNTTYVSNNTIAIAEGTSLFETESVGGSTESVTETVGTEVETETETQAEEPAGSVSEDDLLAASTEDTEVVFDFPEEESTTDTEVSQVYTYIIYK
jgi:hypothetical protein